ncbi:MAG TPA: VCBS repeat-containing protein, partial [Flavisolibacter sp.]|nr:VCBS repeat-containing protein [Flavisolibacter sp.]
GTFLEKMLLPGASTQTKRWEDMGIVLFDADGDNDLDIYISSGSFENERNTESYQDKLYLNDGGGNFSIQPTALPKNFTSTSCVRAADYDRDGDLDLFLAGRVDPSNYPQPVSSFIYRNDSKGGVAKFTDVTLSVAKPLNAIGLICDAVFTDFDNDGWQDLLLAGEWMPLTFLKNTNGVFSNVTATSAIGSKRGWWTSILPGDFDNDGDIDYIAGNLGRNSFYRGNEQEPVKMYVKDYDKNGNLDAVPTLYLPASHQNKERKEYVAHTRDDMAKQMISIRSKFQNYKSYAAATFDQMFRPEELKDALVLTANYFSNSYVENKGEGVFSITALPNAAQYSCINGMLSEDFDGDGNLDLLVNGNDYGTEVSVGRYDACNGLFLKGNGKGGFLPQAILQSGWFVPGNGKALIKLRAPNNKTVVAAGQNRGPLKIFEVKRATIPVALEPMDMSAVIVYKNGKRQKKETGYGASFLSQSGRFLTIDATVSSIEIKNYSGKIRVIKF